MRNMQSAYFRHRHTLGTLHRRQKHAHTPLRILTIRAGEKRHRCGKHKGTPAAPWQTSEPPTGRVDNTKLSCSPLSYGHAWLCRRVHQR